MVDVQEKQVLPSELWREIDTIIRTAFDRLRVRDWWVEESQNFDGDPALFFHIDHDLVPEPINPGDGRLVGVRISRALTRAGEDRVSYVRSHFAPDQPYQDLSAPYPEGEFLPQ